jgi:hypothetical protein
MDTPHSRPLGVTLVAILYLAIAIISLVIAARYVLNPAGNEEMILLFTRLKIPVTFLNLLAVPPLVTAGLATLMFRGLWEERAWARVAALFLGFMGMLATLSMIAFFQVFNWGGPRAMWLAAGAFMLSALVLVYFLKIPWPEPEERRTQRKEEAFISAASPSASAAPPPAPAPVSALSSEQADAIHSVPTVVAGVTAVKGADTVLIETGAVSSSQPVACLTVISGRDQGKHFEITTSDILIGRHPALADFLLQDPTISAQHARIRYEGNQFVIYDLDSTNGLFVNAQRVRQQRLFDGDKLRLGAVELIFSNPCQD